MPDRHLSDRADPRAEADGWEVRRATVDQAPVVADVLLRSRRAAESRDLIPPAIHSDEEIRGWLRDIFGERQVRMAVERGTTAGVLVTDGEWLDQLYVLPEAQERGAGTRLVRHAQDGSSGRLQLWVFQSNTPAIAFYRRRGFVIVESTDGRGNEERAPDHRMEWVADRSGPIGGR